MAIPVVSLLAGGEQKAELALCTIDNHDEEEYSYTKNVLQKLE